MNNDTKLIKLAQAEDTANLLEHIAWTDVVLPKLNRLKDSYGKQLVSHLLGQPLPENLTKEQIAGKIYGIDEMISLFSRILTDGERAFKDLESIGVHISADKYKTR